MIILYKLILIKSTISKKTVISMLLFGTVLEIRTVDIGFHIFALFNTFYT